MDQLYTTLSDYATIHEGVWIKIHEEIRNSTYNKTDKPLWEDIEQKNIFPINRLINRNIGNTLNVMTWYRTDPNLFLF